MKKCFKCGIEKSLTEYYKHKQMLDGHLNKCKECTKSDAHKHREENIDKVRAYDRNRPNKDERAKKQIEYQKSEKGLSVRLKSNRNYRGKFPDRYKARATVGNAIRDGRIFRPDHCEKCNTPCNPHGHHDDYSKPLSVRWLCSSCHISFHTFMRELHRNLEHTGTVFMYEGE
ncbi:MAG: hypothetical protein [Caudoviricetes sp.]|nr:MAG: hypothetical protein [Caudoviricetes sp.]